MFLPRGAIQRRSPHPKPLHSSPPGVAVNQTAQIARARQQQRQLPPHQIDGHHHLRVIRINSLVHQRLAILGIHIQLDAQPLDPVPIPQPTLGDPGAIHRAAEPRTQIIE